MAERMSKMENNTLNINTLTVNEIYALEGVLIGLAGLTKSICQDYKVDSEELLKKLETVTNAWVDEAYGTPA